MTRLAAIVCAVAALAAPAAPVAAASRASLTDIEDEVMCPICGTLLELSQSPQADRERVFIRRLIARGDSKQQIKDALVAEYGQEVLATPAGSGFDLTAYLVPVVAFLIAGGAILIGVRRWRRQGREDDEGSRPGPGPSETDSERLDSDLARYDL